MDRNEKMLDKLFIVRSEEYEKKYSKQHYKDLEKFGVEEKEEQFRKFIYSLKELTETEKSTYTRCLNDLENCMLLEIGYWMEKYYKVGFRDAMNLKDEVNTVEKFENSKEETFENNFFDMYDDDFLEYFETHKCNKIINTPYYAKLRDKMVQLKKDYPNVKSVVEDYDEIELSKEESKALIEILKVMEEIDTLDLKESFKLGGKEAYIYFKGMDMLKI